MDERDEIAFRRTWPPCRKIDASLTPMSAVDVGHAAVSQVRARNKGAERLRKCQYFNGLMMQQRMPNPMFKGQSMLARAPGSKGPPAKPDLSPAVEHRSLASQTPVPRPFAPKMILILFLSYFRPLGINTGPRIASGIIMLN